MSSPVDPSHYHFEIQPIEFLRGSMTKSNFLAYCQGNVVKYVTRHERKNGLEDLQKAKQYLEWMIEYG